MKNLQPGPQVQDFIGANQVFTTCEMVQRAPLKGCPTILRQNGCEHDLPEPTQVAMDIEVT